MDNITDQHSEMGFMGILGVGRGGINAIKMMHKKGVCDASYVICDTDDILLQKSPVGCKVHIKEKKSLSEQTRKQIIQYTQGARLLFVFAGMGGDIGADLLPEIMEVINHEHVLTICILTIPFAFEGEEKIKRAKNSIGKIRSRANAIFELNSELILKQYAETKLSEAFTKLHGVQYDLITEFESSLPWKGYTCGDFADLYATYHNSRYTVMGIGAAAGENRISRAIDIACRFPLFEKKDLASFDTFHLMIYSSNEYQITRKEVEQIHLFMDCLGDKVSFVWSASFMEGLGEEAKVALFACSK
jgi:cell division protein FtsZ